MEDTQPTTEQDSRQRIHQHLMMLAGQILHRSAQTVEEQEAAHYIAKEFRGHINDVRIEEFRSIDMYPFLFGTYYAEFLIINIAAGWVPILAAGYGTIVLGLYLAEFLGYGIYSRMMATYPSQNVVATIQGLRPKGTIILHAYYDSPITSPLFSKDLQAWHRPAHFLLLLCMGIILATCFAEGYSIFIGGTLPLAMPLRWIALVPLIATALFLFFIVTDNPSTTRGANNNASGTAALLELGRRLGHAPCEDYDVILVASGSNSAWMSGIRQFLKGTQWDKARTHFINLEALGSEQLGYSASEGTLQATNSAKNLVDAIKSQNSPFIKSVHVRNIPTATQISMNRGIPSISLIGLNEEGFPDNWYLEEDMVARLNEENILRATDVVETMLRQLK